MAVVTWSKAGKVCCISLINGEELAELVKAPPGLPDGTDEEIGGEAVKGQEIHYGIMEAAVEVAGIQEVYDTYSRFYFLAIPY